MSVRLWLTDGAWAEIAPILATRTSRPGIPPARSDRLWIEAVLSLRLRARGVTHPQRLGTGSRSTIACATGNDAAAGADSGSASRQWPYRLSSNNSSAGE